MKNEKSKVSKSFWMIMTIMLSAFILVSGVIVICVNAFTASHTVTTNPPETSVTQSNPNSESSTSDSMDRFEATKDRVNEINDNYGQNVKSSYSGSESAVSYTHLDVYKRQLLVDEKLSKAAVLFKAPLEGYNPDEVRSWLAVDNSDAQLARAMASVNNQTGWLGHDIDDPDNDEETNNRIIAEHNAWWTLEKELVAEIICRLEHENKTAGTQHVTSGIGYYYVVKPFMERNGYRDGAGWWVK